MRLVSATARGAPMRMPSHSAATVPSTSSVTWVTSPTSRANAASNGSPVRNAAASRLPLARRRIGTEMIAAATPMRTSVRANVRSRPHDDEVARRHQPDAPGAGRALDGGDRRHLGVHQPAQARTIGDESGGPDRRSLRSAPAQNAGGTWSSTIARTDPSATAGLGRVERRR